MNSRDIKVGEKRDFKRIVLLVMDELKSPKWNESASLRDLACALVRIVQDETPGTVLKSAAQMRNQLMKELARPGMRAGQLTAVARADERIQSLARRLGCQVLNFVNDRISYEVLRGIRNESRRKEKERQAAQAQGGEVGQAERRSPGSRVLPQGL